MMKIFIITLLAVIIYEVMLYMHYKKRAAEKVDVKKVDVVTVTPTTIITLYVPYDKLDEDKLDINKIQNLHLNRDTNNYEIRLMPIAGKIPFSEVKKMLDEYHATSYRMGYRRIC